MHRKDHDTPQKYLSTKFKARLADHPTLRTKTRGRHRLIGGEFRDFSIERACP
jgi:hypothetical protein